MSTNPDLMRIFDFTAADLEANCAGHITEHQVQHLSKQVIKKRRFMIFVAVAMPTYMLLSIVLISGLPSSSPMNTQLPITLWIPTTFLILITCLFIIFNDSKNLAGDLRLGTADHVQGTRDGQHAVVGL